MNPMLVVAKETLNLLRDEYAKVKAKIDSINDPKESQELTIKAKEIIDRGNTVKKAIELMEGVLKDKPTATYKQMPDLEEIESLFK